MKRLFQVNKPNGSVAVRENGAPYYAESKVEAKIYRNALNDRLPKPAGNTAEENYCAKLLYTVSYGPDHNKFKN